jgi:hypothetical protein
MVYENSVNIYAVFQALVNNEDDKEVVETGVSDKRFPMGRHFMLNYMTQEGVFHLCIWARAQKIQFKKFVIIFQLRVFGDIEDDHFMSQPLKI